MSASIQSNYSLNAYSTAVQDSAATKQPSGATVQGGSSFLSLALQASMAGVNKTLGLEGLTSGLFTDLSVRSPEELQAQYAGRTEPPTLEEMLHVKYPNLYYHVFDAGSGYWKTRNDYPHHLLYRPAGKAADTLENWTPSGPNPDDCASKEIRALGSVPPCSKAVVIHPAVQARMEEDPEYAYEIMAKIDTWFLFDAMRNEAVQPGCSAEISQAVAIGEDGNICNACTSGQPRITCSGFDQFDWWELRMSRHTDLMKLLVKIQIQHSLQVTQQFRDLEKTAAAKRQLADLLAERKLTDNLGDTIAGISTQTVLDLTRREIWGA